MDDTPDLGLIATMLRQVIAEQATAGDDMRVLTAIVMRQDTTLGAILTEFRAMHSQHSRMDARLRAVEAQQTGAH
jgi:translation elongation factor EF-Tu-like GTPase